MFEMQDLSKSKMAYPQGRDSGAPMVPTAPPPLRRQKPPPQNQPSLLLSQEENQCVFDILGQHRQSLSTAVAQLLVPTPDESDWEKQETGVVCFVRDQIMKSYFIELLSLRTKTFIFRQEMYTEFEYEMPLQFFLTFEGDETMIGINFADESEASRFREALDSKLESKKQRKNSRQSRLGDMQWQQSYSSNSNIGPSGIRPSDEPVSHGDSGSKGRQITSSFGRKRNKKDKNKGGLSKADIGAPMNFRHVQHVGFDPSKGFDLDGDVDKNLQALLKKVGVSDQQFKDANTREFIYNFIDQHGGLDAVKNEISSDELPPPPPDLLNCGEDTDALPLPPNLRPLAKNKPSVPPRPPAPVVSSPAQGGGAGPPPPPPPPPLSLEGPPPPPLAPLRSSKANESESNCKVSSASAGDDRSNLMMQIQMGISLKKVVAEPQKQAPTDHIGGLASALARSLAERNKAMRLSDSDSSDSVEAEDLEDDEWD